MADNQEVAKADGQDERLYTPLPGEAQLTARAIIAGCLIGSVVSCTNIYIGLKIGWSFGASIITAVLGFAVFAVIGKRLSVLETNAAQTTGSAAGSMSSAAGLLAAIPAMNLLGYEIPWWALMLWSVAVAFLGVFYAVPLRRQMVEVDKLRFPTGLATAETILAMFSEAAESMAKAKVLVFCGLAAGLFTLASHFLPELEKPPLHQWLPVLWLELAAGWTFSIYLGPSLFGAGFLIGPRVVLSLVVGALVAWGVLGPVAQSYGWAPGDVMDYKQGPHGWILWPGVALMVSEALTSVTMSWRNFFRALKFPTAIDQATQADDSHIPNRWWIGGLAAGSVVTLVIAQTVFGIPWLQLSSRRSFRQ